MNRPLTAARAHRVIVNADDFGLDLDYNQLTLRAFKRGAVSYTHLTLPTNREV